jgi:hypothetical protein
MDSINTISFFKSPNGIYKVVDQWVSSHSGYHMVECEFHTIDCKNGRIAYVKKTVDLYAEQFFASKHEAKAYPANHEKLFLTTEEIAMADIESMKAYCNESPNTTGMTMEEFREHKQTLAKILDAEM